MANEDLNLIIRARDRASGVIDQVGRNLDRMAGSGATVAEKMQVMGRSMSQVGSTMTTRLTAPIVAGAGAAIYQFSKFEDAMVEVQKVTDETTAEVLTDSIKEMSEEIPIAREQLAGIAADAARFGIRGTANIEEFTKTVSQMSVATDLTAQEAGQAFAKLSTLTETPVQEVSNLGSAINALSNTAAASSGEIVDSMLRGSAALSNLGLQNTEIVAVSGALNEVSASSERAGTRLRRLGTELMDPSRVEGVANALGMTSQQFKQIQQNAPVELIRQMATEFSNNTATADKLRGTLTQVSQQVLSGLGKNLDGLNKALATTADEYEKNTSLAAEFEAANNTLSAMFTRLMNTIENAGDVIAEALVDEVVWLIEKIEAAANAFENANPAIQKAAIIFGAVAAAIGPILVVAGQLISSIGTIAGLFTTTGAAGGALSGVFAGLGAVLTGPVVAGFAAVAAAVYGLYKNWDKIKNHPVFKKLWDLLRYSLQEVWNALGELWASFKELWAMVDQWVQPALEVFAGMLGAAVLGAIQVVVGAVWAFVKGLTALIDGLKTVMRWLGMAGAEAETTAYKVSAAEAAANRWAYSTGNTLKPAAQRMSTVQGELNSQVDMFADKTDEANNAMEITRQEFAGIQDSATGAGASVEAAGEQMSDAMQAVNEDIKSTRDEILGLYDEINNRSDNYKDKEASAEADYRDKVVGIVTEAKAKEKELEKELRREQKKQDDSRVYEIRQNLKQQRAIQKTYKNFEMDLDDEIRRQQELNRMNELERAQAEYERKRLLAKKEYLEEQKASLQKIVQAKAEHDRLVGLKQNEVALRKEYEKEATQVWNEELASRRSNMVSFANESVQQYRRIEEAAKDAARAQRRAGGNPSRRVNDAVISPSGDVLSVHPRDYLIATQNPNELASAGGGGGTNIVFNNPRFMGTGREVAEEVAKHLGDKLRRNNRV